MYQVLFVLTAMDLQYTPPLPSPTGQQAGHTYKLAAYSISRRYLYTVGLDSPQILASSLTFIFFAANVG